MSPCHDIMSLKRQLPVIMSNCGVFGKQRKRALTGSPAQRVQYVSQNEPFEASKQNNILVYKAFIQLLSSTQSKNEKHVTFLLRTLICDS